MADNPYQSPQVAAFHAGSDSSDSSRRMGVLATVVALIGVGIGAVSRLARPLFEGPIHYEAIGELVLKIVIGLALAGVCYLWDDRRPLKSYWGISACLWGGALLGWSLINLKVWEDYVFVSLLWMLLTTSVGTAGLLIWRKKRRHYAGNGSAI